MAKAGKTINSARKKHDAAQSETRREANSAKPPRVPGASASTVRVGLHGLGAVLRAIHESPEDLQKKFESEMGSANLTVVLDSDVATKVKTFVENHLSDHPVAMRLNRDNCDPATDPWCINL